MARDLTAEVRRRRSTTRSRYPTAADESGTDRVRKQLHTVQQELEDARNVVAGAADFARRIEQDGRVESDADVPDLPAIRQVLAQAKDDVKHLEHRLAHLQQLCSTLTSLFGRRKNANA